MGKISPLFTILILSTCRPIARPFLQLHYHLVHSYSNSVSIYHLFFSFIFFLPIIRTGYTFSSINYTHVRKRLFSFKQKLQAADFKLLHFHQMKAVGLFHCQQFHQKLKAKALHFYRSFT